MKRVSRAATTIINLDKQGNPQPPKIKIATTIKCDKCGGPMILRDSKRGPFLGCSSFPKCRSTKMMKKLTGADLQQAEELVPLFKEGAAQRHEMVVEDPRRKPRRRERCEAIDDCHGHRLRRVRQTDGDPQRPPRLLPRLQRISEVQNTGEVPARLVEEMGLDNKERGATAEAAVLPEDAE